MHTPEPVIYVDVAGKRWNARTLERPRDGEPTRLLVMHGRSLCVMTVRRSDVHEGATWHYPPKPS